MNLFFANKAAKKVQRNLGYDLAKGCSRYDMFKNTIDKGAFKLPEGISIRDYLNKTVDMLRERKEGYPNSDNVMKRSVLLPLHHGMTEKMFDYFYNTLEEFIKIFRF